MKPPPIGSWVLLLLAALTVAFAALGGYAGPEQGIVFAVYLTGWLILRELERQR